MQAVNDKWYIVYTRISVALAVLLVLACAGGLLIPGFRPYAEKWALSYATLGVALAQILYVVIFYRGEAQQNSYWSATLILALIQSLNIINFIQATGQFHSWYLVGWALFVLMSGMFGNYAVVGSAFLVTSYFILLINQQAKSVINIYGLGGLFGTYVLGVVSYIVWRRFYVDQQSAEISKLSGALKSKQLQTAILIQSIADGMIVTDTEGKITMLNPAASAITQWPMEEAENVDVNLVVKLNKEDGQEILSEENPFTRVFTQKQAINETLQLTGRDGKQSVVSLAISPVILPKTQELVGAVAVMRDISNARAEEQRRADFISTASHEMRTPVAAIEGYLALALNDKVSQIDSHARDYLEKAHASTKHLGQLFQDLLTSAKAEDGRLVSHPVVVEMGAFLEQIVESLRFSAEQKGLLIEFIIGSGEADKTGGNNKIIRPLYYVHVDPDRVREVITNLFDNAVKYTPAGKISIGLTGNATLVQLFVRDTGPGISPDDVPHLFQKFYRVDNSATRTIGGTGLGLFICRKIIELYKGRIWVESTLGKGSTFYINLPRLDSQRASALQVEEAQHSSILPSVPTGGGSL